MKNFTASVRKLTDENLMREACECTFLGTTHQSLLSIYKSEHSPVRTQLFWIKLENIPLFVSTHLLRHTVGAVPFQLTCRSDRQGGNPNLPSQVDSIKERMEMLRSQINRGSYNDQFEIIDKVEEALDWIANNCDRQTPVNLGICLNAQSLLNMSRRRLCNQASKETIEVFKEIKAKIQQIDPDLAIMMQPLCIFRNGLCGEPRCCGYNSTSTFQKELEEYRNNFNDKQKGLRYATKINSK